jgi:hypothetical protein
VVASDSVFEICVSAAGYDSSKLGVAVSSRGVSAASAAQPGVIMSEAKPETDVSFSYVTTAGSGNASVNLSQESVASHMEVMVLSKLLCLCTCAAYYTPFDAVVCLWLQFSDWPSLQC